MGARGRDYFLCLDNVAEYIPEWVEIARDVHAYKAHGCVHAVVYTYACSYGLIAISIWCSRDIFANFACAVI